MKLVFLLAMGLSLITSFAEAEGGPGGGTGCKGLFMRSAYEVFQWLDSNGSTLSPPITGNDFLVLINPNDVTPTFEDIQYKGQPVDVLFDGQKFQTRCDRLEANTDEARRTVVTHEIFRKMDQTNNTNFEGDGYGVSRQIPILNVPSSKPTPAEMYEQQYLSKQLGYGIRGCNTHMEVVMCSDALRAEHVDRSKVQEMQIVLRDYPSENGGNVYIVLKDGAVVNHRLPICYPIGGCQ